MYVFAVVSVPVLMLPLAAFVPLQSPLAVHDDAPFVASQLIVELSPAKIRFGFAAMLTAGTPEEVVDVLPGFVVFGAVTLTATVLKPVPVSVLQVSVNK